LYLERKPAKGETTIGTLLNSARNSLATGSLTGRRCRGKSVRSVNQEGKNREISAQAGEETSEITGKRGRAPYLKRSKKKGERKR